MTPERPVKTNPGINEIIKGDPWQIRAPRIDAMLKKARKEVATMFSFERETRRSMGDDCSHPQCGMHCEEERKEIRILAGALALTRWWPLSVALQLSRKFDEHDDAR